MLFPCRNYRVVLYFHVAVRVSPLPLGAGENREPLVPSSHPIAPVLFVGRSFGLFLFYLRLFFISVDFVIKTIHVGKVSKEK